MAGLDQTIVITGGASGIGAATARSFASKGYHVGIIDLNEAAARSLADEIGVRAACASADILDPERVRAAHDQIASALPPITGLVNCAGIPQIPTPIEDLPVETWERVVDSHLKGTYIACQVIGGAMALRGTGAVVNLASVVGFHPGPVLAYGPAKAAVINLTQVLSVAWARKGVRVNAVAPGWTDTPFLRPPERGHQRDLTPILNAIPMGRVLDPDEIADVIAFLVSPASRAITGVTIPCDGGFVAGLGWTAFGGFPG